MTERQRLFQAQLGVSLSDNEAAVFAYACRSDRISITDTKAVIGAGNREAKEVLDRLVTMVLLRAVEEGILWDVAEHLKERFPKTEQTTDQPLPKESDLVTEKPDGKDVSLVTPGLTNLTEPQRKIIELCEVPRKREDLMHKLGLMHRAFFRRKHLKPLIQANLVSMTHPDSPNHPNQAYVVTEAGFRILVSWKAVGDSKDGK